MEAQRLEEINLELQGESVEQRRRRLGKSPMTQENAQETGDDLHSRNGVKRSDENSSYNKYKVQPLLPLETTDGGKR